MRKHLKILTAIAAFSFAIAGCGGGSSDTTATDTTTDGTTATDTTAVVVRYLPFIS